MNFNVFSELYNHHHNLILEYFFNLKTKICANLQLLFIPTSNYSKTFSVSIELAVLDILYEWNSIIYCFLCLAAFIEQNVFEVHPCCLCINS